jgi:hypothetical protein
MPKSVSYVEIRERFRRIFDTADDVCPPQMLQQCCVLTAVMTLGAEGPLLDQVSAQQCEDLLTLWQHLRQLCFEEIRLVNTERQRQAAEVYRQGLLDDVMREVVEATLYRDFCGILPVLEPDPVKPCDASMTADAFLEVFPGWAG